MFWNFAKDTNLLSLRRNVINKWVINQIRGFGLMYFHSKRLNFRKVAKRKTYFILFFFHLTWKKFIMMYRNKISYELPKTFKKAEESISHIIWCSFFSSLAQVKFHSVKSITVKLMNEKHWKTTFPNEWRLSGHFPCLWNTFKASFTPLQSDNILILCVWMEPLFNVTK